MKSYNYLLDMYKPWEGKICTRSVWWKQLKESLLTDLLEHW